MVGGNNAIKQRVQSLIRRYGSATMAEAMDQVIAVSEAKMRAILREIPDGRWDTVNYLDYYDQGRMNI